jgi:hypothetical protein
MRQNILFTAAYNAVAVPIVILGFCEPARSRAVVLFWVKWLPSSSGRQNATHQIYQNSGLERLFIVSSAPSRRVTLNHGNPQNHGNQ